MTESNAIQKFVTKAEAAEVLQVSTRTIERWVRDGHLIKQKTPTRPVRFSSADIEALLTPQSSSPVSDIPVGTRTGEERFSSAGDAA